MDFPPPGSRQDLRDAIKAKAASCIGAPLEENAFIASQTLS
jgi:hypothetical protein